MPIGTAIVLAHLQLKMNKIINSWMESHRPRTEFRLSVLSAKVVTPGINITPKIRWSIRIIVAIKLQDLVGKSKSGEFKKARKWDESKKAP